MNARTRWVLVLLALAAAISLAIAVQGARWWHAGEIGVGPGGTLICAEGGECRGNDLAWLGGSEMWRKAGLATMTASLLATIALVALAGTLAAKRAGRLAAGATLTATLTSAVAGAIFLVRFPGIGAGVPVDAGAGIVLWLAGITVAAVIAVFVLRRR